MNLIVRLLVFQKELIGSTHSIMRHPDMNHEVFEIFGIQ